MKIVLKTPTGEELALVVETKENMYDVLVRNEFLEDSEESLNQSNKWFNWLSQDVTVLVNSDNILSLRQSKTVKLLEPVTDCSECGQPLQGV